MKEAKKKLMRLLPHIALRSALGAMEVRHHRVVKRIRRELGLQRPPFDFQGLRRSDSVFLFGSGASVNDIGPDRWNAISVCDSIGLNFWIRHPFVPDFYFFEAAPRPYFQRLVNLAHERRRDYESVLKIATSHINYSPYLERQFSELPPSWQTGMWPLDTSTIFARDDSELRKEIGRLMRGGLFPEQGAVTRLFKYMGTITSLISLSVLMGYRNIVLCGVDLSNSGYFYQDENQYPDMKGFISSYRTKRHYLMADNLPHCGADQVIGALDELILKPRGASLFVENASSALHPAIPVAPDSLFAGRS